MAKPKKSLGECIEEHYSLLVSILETDNPPGEEDAIRTLMQRELTKLGATTTVDAAGNLIGKIGAGHKGAVLLGGHLDSVMPCKGVKVVREGSVLTSDGSTVLCSDNGAGMFEVLMAISYMQEMKLPMPPLDIVFTVGEEIGGVGAKKLDTSTLRARHGILMDRAAAPGTMVMQAPYKHNFRVDFYGVAAHALEAAKGVSAIHMAAECIAKFPQGKISRTCTANIGKVRGGEAVNQVPEYVVIEGEVRSFKAEEAEGVIKTYMKMMNAIDNKYSKKGENAAHIEFTYTDRREGYKHDRNAPLVKAIAKACKKVGVKPVYQSTWGCSDAGEITNRGIPTVNCGYGGHNIHSKSEWIDMKDIEDATAMLIEVLQTMAKAQ